MTYRSKKRNHQRRARQTPWPNSIRIGVVGLGLMGKSVAACLLGAGHAVTGLDSDAGRRRNTKDRIFTLLKEMREEGLLKESARELIGKLNVSGDYHALAPCDLVIEAITEDLKTKRNAIDHIELVVSAGTLIASNTSAIPISSLQKGCRHPERVIGMHWDEPAHVTRFMEIICGLSTSRSCAERAVALAKTWGKEPSLVKKDVRGFITNRISYAMFREACHLVESGVATVADVDRSLRNDVGYWMTFAGPFRYMDLMGIPAYAKVMVDLLPDLNRSTKIPNLMRKVVGSGCLGISNRRGFYRYTRAQAARWERLFLKFNYEIRKLAMKYPEDAGDRPFEPGRSRKSSRSVEGLGPGKRK